MKPIDPLRTPSNLAARCRRIYGRAWRKGLMRDLAIPSATLGNYVYGRTPIPRWLVRVLEMIEARKRCTCGAHAYTKDTGQGDP